eukprot:5926680-Karenia_brevis.AAC.1
MATWAKSNRASCNIKRSKKNQSHATVSTCRMKMIQDSIRGQPVDGNESMSSKQKPNRRIWTMSYAPMPCPKDGFFLVPA